MQGLSPITQEGYDNLVKEHEHLKRIERPNIIKAVADARSHGDISENAEYHAAREKQSHIESRIKYLEDKIARSEIIKVGKIESDTIVFGSTVKLIEIESDSEEEYTLVGADETDPANGKISTLSPIGKSLIGKRKNDIITVITPRGEIKFKIIDF